MSYFKYFDGRFDQGEEIICESNSVNVYDIEEKMVITSNKLHLTSHRLILSDQYNSRTDLKLSTIVNTEIKKSERILSSSNNRTNSRQTLARVVIYFNDKPLIQFEFEYGGHNEFLDQLNQQLIRKHWLYGSSSSTSTDKATMSFGIAGIQKKIQDRLDTQDQKINDSFKDLNVLMNQAKEMVSLSNVLISKLSKDKIKSSDATNLDDEDEEMKKLKTCFNNMGIIDNPVTKESSGSKYHKDLALEIYNTLSNKINEQGGIMTLVDAFCFLNRARAIAGLISPEDHINACKQLNKLNVNLKYNVYSDLNLHVLEVTQSSISNKITQEVCRLIETNESLSAYNLGKLLNCNLIVAKKYLLDLEKMGQLCRDDTALGLRFYTNKFVKNIL